jgi:hypothetical protein
MLAKLRDQKIAPREQQAFGRFLGAIRAPACGSLRPASSPRKATISRS